jgi:hypothetical protein
MTTTTSIRRGRLAARLLSTTMFGGIAAAAFPGSAALAACATSGSGPVTFTCAASTATTNTTNSTSPASTSDRIQSFNDDIIGQVNAGVIITNFGINLVSTKTNGAIDFTNNGTIRATGLPVLQLDGGGGNVSYSGNGIIGATGANANGLVIANANTVTVDITGGSITADGNTVRGVSLSTSGTSTGGISFTANAGHSIVVANTASGGTHYGMEVSNAGTAGDISLTTGSISGTGIGNLWGIGATNSAAANGNITVTNNGSISTLGGGSGLLLTNNGATGNITVNANASITAGAGGAAIDTQFQTAATGSAKVTIAAGAAVSGAVGWTLTGTTSSIHELTLGAAPR